MNKRRPVHEIRLGKIKAIIWENESANGSRYNVQIRRLFNRSGAPQDWEESDSFGRDDLLVVAKIAHMAYEGIHAQQQPDESSA